MGLVRWGKAGIALASALLLLGAAEPSPLNELVSVPTVPLETETRPVIISRVVSKLSTGQPFGTAKGGALCIPNGPLLYSPENVATLRERLPQVFYAEATSAGFKSPVDPNNLFPDQQAPTGEYLIAASVEAQNVDACFPLAGFGDLTTAKGTATYTIEWQIYSTIERRVVSKVQTTGTFTIKKSVSGAAIQLSQGALTIAARKFLASPEFRAAFIGRARPPEQVVKAATGLKPLSLAISNDGPTTVSDSVGGVVAVLTGTGFGSGFLIDKTGHLLTNQHVVGQSTYVKIRWSDGLETLGEVLRTDARRDVALIKTEPRGRVPLRIGRNAPLPGDEVYAVGTPLDQKFQSTVTRGVVSANRVFDGFTFIQSDVAVNPGNSGGPLLDKSANVVGLTVAGYRVGGAPSGINLFIPIGDALDFLGVSPQ